MLTVLEVEEGYLIGMAGSGVLEGKDNELDSHETLSKNGALGGLNWMYGFACKLNLLIFDILLPLACIFSICFLFVFGRRNSVTSDARQGPAGGINSLPAHTLFLSSLQKSTLHIHSVVYDFYGSSEGKMEGRRSSVCWISRSSRLR